MGFDGFGHLLRRKGQVKYNTNCILGMVGLNAFGVSPIGTKVLDVITSAASIWTLVS